MVRKIVLCVFVLMLGVISFPDLFAWEKEEETRNGFFVREFLVNAAFVDLRWLIIPREWRGGLSLAQDQPGTDLNLAEVPDNVQIPELPLPKFRYSALVLPLSEKHGMDWKLVAAVMATESNYNPRAISSKGAIGLMQLMPRTAALYRVSYKELFNPEKNIEAGVRHLKMLHDRYDGDLSLIVAAYNSGESAVNRYNGVPPYRHTKAFVRRVMARYQSHIQKEALAIASISGSIGKSLSVETLQTAVGYK